MYDIYDHSNDDNVYNTNDDYHIKMLICKYINISNKICNNHTLQETPQDDVYSTDDEYHINMLISKCINVYNKTCK